MQPEHRTAKNRRPEILLESLFSQLWGLDMREIHAMMREEQALWRAVITQALMDAASNSSKTQTLQRRNEARKWLFSGSLDFNRVCDLAGLDPGYVRRKSKWALLRSGNWRTLAEGV